jgi:hypothetical protein
MRRRTNNFKSGQNQSRVPLAGSLVFDPELRPKGEPE